METRVANLEARCYWIELVWSSKIKKSSFSKINERPSPSKRKELKWKHKMSLIKTHYTVLATTRTKRSTKLLRKKMNQKWRIEDYWERNCDDTVKKVLSDQKTKARRQVGQYSSVIKGMYLRDCLMKRVARYKARYIRNDNRDIFARRGKPAQDRERLYQRARALESCTFSVLTRIGDGGK